MSEWCWSEEAETGRPIPRPSYNFLDASSRGERDDPLEEEDLGVSGEEELTEEASSLSVLSEVSMVTAGRGWVVAPLKRNGWGLNLAGREGDSAKVSGGGVIFTLGEETARLFPLRTE